MKRLILGLVIGLMLGMSTSAIAAIGDKVEAVFSKFNYVVDGEEKELDSPVLVYEGTSYVRTTQIANLLGFDVTYKSDSRTIEFNNPNPMRYETSVPTPAASQTPSPTPTAKMTSPDVINAQPTTISPTTAPTATPTPIPTATPKPDNTAQCQAIRDSNALELASFNETHNPFSGSTEYLRGLLISQQNSKLAAAGCN